MLFYEATLVSGVKIHLFQVPQRVSFIWSSSQLVMPLKCRRDKSLREKKKVGGGRLPLGATGNTVSGAQGFISQGLQGLKLKITLKSASPTIKLSCYIPPSLIPPAITPSPEKIKSCRHRAGDELGVDPLWWQRMILLFPNPHTQPLLPIFPVSPTGCRGASQSREASIVIHLKHIV